MSFIDLNERDNNQSNLFPKGTYEMHIVDVTGDASNSGHENLKFEFEVRRDLDKVPALANTNAKTHGRHYFARVWTMKDDNGNDSGKYSQKDLANIASAIGFKTQEKINKYLKSKEDLMKYAKGKNIRIYISLRDNEYQGQTRKQNSTFTSSWQVTKYPTNKQAKKPEDPFKESKTTEISDDDLPF